MLSDLYTLADAICAELESSGIDSQEYAAYIGEWMLKALVPAVGQSVATCLEIRRNLKDAENPTPRLKVPK
jgi:hypothetical protein